MSTLYLDESSFKVSLYAHIITFTFKPFRAKYFSKGSYDRYQTDQAHVSSLKLSIRKILYSLKIHLYFYPDSRISLWPDL